MHFESTDSSAVVCELQSELVAQAVASLSTGFSAADGCTFFSKTTHNVPKSLPLLPCFGSAIVVEPIGGDGFSCGSPPKVLKSNIPSPLFWSLWSILAVLDYFGHCGLFWLFWAILDVLGYFRRLGLFFLFWAVLDVFGYFRRLGLFELFLSIKAMKGYFSCFRLFCPF